jgi:hypothetical protein
MIPLSSNRYTSNMSINWLDLTLKSIKIIRSMDE